MVGVVVTNRIGMEGVTGITDNRVIVILDRLILTTTRNNNIQEIGTSESLTVTSSGTVTSRPTDQCSN